MTNLLFAAACVAVFLYCIEPLLYMAQLEGYSPLYFKGRNPKVKKYFAKILFLSLFFGIISAIFCKIELSFVMLTVTFLAATAFRRSACFLSSFKFTKRGCRLFLLCGLAEVLALCFSGNGTLWMPFLLLASAPVSVSVLLAVCLPFENLVKAFYVNRASAKLKKSGATVVGITGSYAKSSVKTVLTAFLSQKYRTYSTLGNFNTPTGFALSVKKMPPDTEYFVVEMGARHVGDVDEMCKLCHPKYGIVTGIAPQHLETFLSVENIMFEKSRLPNSLPPDGFAVVRDLSKSACGKVDVAKFGIDFFVEETECSCDGTKFVLSVDGERIVLETGLLGEHNASNVALAAVLALKLGVSVEQIKKAASNLKPLPHRLSVQKVGDVTIIDDSYNANPKGVAAAIGVLKSFGGRKIVVTPGMVELGDMEREENFKLGRSLAFADAVLLTGGRCSDYVAEGLLSENYIGAKRFGSLLEAQKKLKEILRPGDVVLFLNDLPDNYD